MEWVEKLGVVPIKADKSRDAPEVDALLVELGNTSRGIPFYAIYPGDGRPPIVFDGFLTQNQVIEKLKEAGPSAAAAVPASAGTQQTAMQTR